MSQPPVDRRRSTGEAIDAVEAAVNAVLVEIKSYDSGGETAGRTARLIALTAVLNARVSILNSHQRTGRRP